MFGDRACPDKNKIWELLGQSILHIGHPVLQTQVLCWGYTHIPQISWEGCTCDFFEGLSQWRQIRKTNPRVLFLFLEPSTGVSGESNLNN
jgi:hypothetical protein